MAAKSLETLVNEGADLVREWHRSKDGRTQVLRDLAAVVVAMRGRFRDSDGNKDWAGNSYDYRMTVARMYELSGIPARSVSTVQASLRYHVGNRIRETVPAEEREAAGLMAASPKDRITSARHEAATLAAAAAGGANRSGLDVTRLCQAALDCVEGAVERLEMREGLAPEDRRELVAVVRELREAVARLGKDVRAARATPSG